MVPLVVQTKSLPARRDKIVLKGRMGRIVVCVNFLYGNEIENSKPACAFHWVWSRKQLVVGLAISKLEDPHAHSLDKSFGFSYLTG